jgi:hypothetical protein
MADPEFLRGEIDTGFVDRLLAKKSSEMDEETLIVALVAAAHLRQRTRRPASGATGAEGSWALSGRQTQHHRGGARNPWSHA